MSLPLTPAHESFGEGHDEDNKTLNDVFVTYTELKTRTSGSFFHKKIILSFDNSESVVIPSVGQG